MCDYSAEKLYAAILSLHSVEECESLFSDLFTKKEIKDLSSRLEVARLLSEGVNYIEIAKQTGASTATISRVSKCLTGEAGGYRLVLPRVYSASPKLSILVSAEPEYISAYESLSAIWRELPSLPRDVGGVSSLRGVSVTLRDPRDAAAIFIGGGVDFFIGSLVELMEEGAEYIEVKKLPGFESLVVSAESDSPVRLVSAYPSISRRLLATTGSRATVTRGRAGVTASALGFDGVIGLVCGERAVEDALLSVPFALVARADLPTELSEYVTAALGE